MSEQTFFTKEFIDKLERLSIFSRKVLHGLLKGERRSTKKGVSIEFADYRDYVPGDDLRFLDWNIYARLEQLFLKIFQEEEDLNIYFLLDRSKSMDFGSPNKLTYGKKLVAALAYIALKNLDRVAIGTFSSDLDNFFPLTRGKQSAWRMFDFLEQIKPSKPENTTNLYESFKSFALKFKSSSIIIIVSDFMAGDFESALKFFANNNCDTFVFHILSQEELDPPLAGDLKLSDSENGPQVDISISSKLLDRYRMILSSYIQNIHSWCLKHNIFYLYSSNQKSFDDLILKYLKSIGMLR